MDALHVIRRLSLHEVRPELGAQPNRTYFVLVNGNRTIYAYATLDKEDNKIIIREPVVIKSPQLNDSQTLLNARHEVAIQNRGPVPPSMAQMLWMAIFQFADNQGLSCVARVRIDRDPTTHQLSKETMDAARFIEELGMEPQNVDGHYIIFSRQVNPSTPFHT